MYTSQSRSFVYHLPVAKYDVCMWPTLSCIATPLFSDFQVPTFVFMQYSHHISLPMWYTSGLRCTRKYVTETLLRPLSSLTVQFVNFASFARQKMCEFYLLYSLQALV